MQTTSLVLDLALIGISLTSATAIIHTKDQNAWLDVQDNFIIPLRQAISTIRRFYNLAIYETMLNVQLYVNHLL